MVTIDLGRVVGKSAYEIAVDNGFEGTEQEWLDSLEGIQGEKGDTGPQGPKGATGATGPAGTWSYTTMWSGTSSTSSQTLYLNSSYSSYKFILVVGAMYSSSLAQRMSLLIPTSICGAATSNDKDDFLIEGGTENTMRRLRFRFTSGTTLYKLASEGTSSHLPVIIGVYGIK